MWSCWPRLTFINAVCAHPSKWMPHAGHPATGISQSVETERGPPPPAPCPPLQPVLVDCNQRGEASDDHFLFHVSVSKRFLFWKWRIRRRVFWRRSIDGTGWYVRSLTVPLVMGGGRPRLTLIISSYHNDISSRLHTSRWFSDGQEAEEWLPCHQSIALLPLRNPVGWYHSYFIPGKDYLSDPWEMYWSVFLFPPAITWQRHLGSEWMSDVWCVCSTVEASTGHRLVLGGSAAQIMQS